MLDEQRATELGELVGALLEAEQDRRVELRFHCLDCDVHTAAIGQYPYSCPDELWHAVVPNGHGMLCLGCLAARLDAAGLPWPWAVPVEQMAAELLAIAEDFSVRKVDEPQGEQLAFEVA